MVREHITRRNFVKSAAGAGIAGLAGCAGGAGGGGTVELVHAIPGGSWGEWENDFFNKPWEEETGNEIDERNLSGGATNSKLQSNKNDPVFHLAHGSNANAIAWSESDLIVKQSDRVDNFDKVSSALKNEYMAGKVLTPFGLGVNTDQVDIEITSWQDLLASELQGKVALPAWEWMGNQWLYVINDIMGGSATNIEPGLEFIRKMVQDQDAMVMSNTDAGLRLFKNEEVLVAPYWSARTDQVALNSDVNMQFVYPEEGAFKFFFNEVIVKGQPEEEMEAAADFVSYSLNAERQAKFSEQAGYPPTIPEAVDMIDDSVLEERPSLQVTQQDMDNMANIEIDWRKVNEVRADHVEEWRKVVRG